MAWIKTIPFAEADEKLRRALEAQHSLYPKEYERKPDDTSESIVATHTLLPEVLHHAFAAFGALRRLGTPCVFWTVQPEGRRAVAPEAQVRRVAARVSPGAIVDLHDADGVPGAGTRLAQALPDLIDALRQRGFALAPLRDLL